MNAGIVCYGESHKLFFAAASDLSKGLLCMGHRRPKTVQWHASAHLKPLGRVLLPATPATCKGHALDADESHRHSSDHKRRRRRRRAGVHSSGSSSCAFGGRGWGSLADILCGDDFSGTPVSTPTTVVFGVDSVSAEIEDLLYLQRQQAFAGGGLHSTARGAVGDYLFDCEEYDGEDEIEVDDEGVSDCVVLVDAFDAQFSLAGGGG